MTRPSFDHTAPIGASDAAIASALEAAHLPTLIAALVHLTGDTELLRQAGRLSFEFFGDGQGGLQPELAKRMRQEALRVLIRHRDAGSPRPASLDFATVQELMQFVAGQPIPLHYLPLLLEELALEGQDSKAGSWLQSVSDAERRDFQVLIVGAGLSGIAVAVRLAQLGIPFSVIDKNANVGGTWLENTYPGCRVDTPNHMYSFSFETGYEWPQHYSTQPVLLEYLRHVAAKHGVREHVRFRTTVESATWSDTDQCWTVRVRDVSGRAEALRARAVISAVGQLNRPRYPEIPGRERFAGPAFHSARWDHDCDLRGKRVAVIGTGASAFQFVPEIAPHVQELLLFQRSAPWLGPTANYHDDVADGMKWLLRHVPYYAKWYRFWLFWTMTDGLLPAVSVDPTWRDTERSVSPANEYLRKLLTAQIERQVGHDPALLAAAVPDYPPGGKRMLRDNGVWLRTLQRDNVRLFTTPIRELTEHGIRTTDGEEHRIDVLIYGTGFEASRFLQPMRITGRDGLDLHDHWGGDARAYLGMSVPDFPNFFMMYGPNTNIVVNGSILFFAECQARYILGCIDLLLQRKLAGMCVKRDVHDTFNRRVDDQNARMAWGVPSVESWYKNAKGRVSQNWPFSLVDFWNATQAPNPDDFDLHRSE